ncbi:uncharacterized protein LOC111277441 [Durio zibethinus]|uniref:Uncharacterized protein LOC111277441 n=1 Tax=Durio zibethinus TaxID=66656 RepID=A0A6P5WVD3_DURZI|nr:uncharacterized protein LOC111277441 [Durio zibethinus]
MLYHTTWLISKLDPLKYIFEKPSLSGRLFEFPDEDLMAILQDENKEPVREVWKIFFDEASNIMRHGIGAVLISPEENYYPCTIRLDFNYRNNVTEYEACIIGLQMAIEKKIKTLKVYGDLTLVIYQLKGKWEARDLKLMLYQKHITSLMKHFKEIQFQHVP